MSDGFVFTEKKQNPLDLEEFPYEVVSVRTDGQNLSIDWNSDIIEAALSEEKTRFALMQIPEAVRDTLRRALNIQ